MDNIIVADVTEIIRQSHDRVIMAFSADSFASSFFSKDSYHALFSWYDWAFKNALVKIYGVYVHGFDNNNHTFKSVYSEVEPILNHLLYQHIDRQQLSQITIGRDIQTAFNGKLLFIMPCHTTLNLKQPTPLAF